MFGNGTAAERQAAIQRKINEETGRMPLIYAARFRAIKRAEAADIARLQHAAGILPAAPEADHE